MTTENLLVQYDKDLRIRIAYPEARKEITRDVVRIIRNAPGMNVVAFTFANEKKLHDVITGLGMAALVEVHDEHELERALKIGATLIGVNNRDLRTFQVDPGITERIARLLPEDVLLVAESGIHSPEDVRRMGDLGARAVLVGEALMLAENRAAAVREFSNQPSPPNPLSHKEERGS